MPTWFFRHIQFSTWVSMPSQQPCARPPLLCVYKIYVRPIRCIIRRQLAPSDFKWLFLLSSHFGSSFIVSLFVEWTEATIWSSIENWICKWFIAVAVAEMARINGKSVINYQLSIWRFAWLGRVCCCDKQQTASIAQVIEVKVVKHNTVVHSLIDC